MCTLYFDDDGLLLSFILLGDIFCIKSLPVLFSDYLIIS